MVSTGEGTQEEKAGGCSQSAGQGRAKAVCSDSFSFSWLCEPTLTSATTAVSFMSLFPLAQPLGERPLRPSRQCPSLLEGLLGLALGAEKAQPGEHTLRSSYF